MSIRCNPHHDEKAKAKAIPVQTPQCGIFTLNLSNKTLLHARRMIGRGKNPFAPAAPLHPARRLQDQPHHGFLAQCSFPSYLLRFPGIKPRSAVMRRAVSSPGLRTLRRLVLSLLGMVSRAAAALHGRDVGAVLQRLGEVADVADNVSVALDGEGYDRLYEVMRRQFWNGGQKNEAGGDERGSYTPRRERSIGYSQSSKR